MDDAGVYRISDNVALVQSVDFFSPIVNSPYDFGQIAAANSLSDIYAMGGIPRTAMNILAYPPGQIPPEVIKELLTGAAEKLKEANVALVGGHTMEQEELFYGMSITGTIHPDNIKTNSSAKEGDVVILTKPLGAGPYSDAVAQDGLSAAQYTRFVTTMARLNKYACEAVAEFNVSAMTDITGFGLLGHSLAIARNADVLLEYDSAKVPFLDDIFDLMMRFNLQGVCKNSEYFGEYISVSPDVDQRKIKLMTEAQTSGGLLIVIECGQAEAAINSLHEHGDRDSRIIGKVKPRHSDKFLSVT